MAVAKILGIETEYGGPCRGTGPRPDQRLERARQRLRHVGLAAHGVGLRRREPRARRARHADDRRAWHRWSRRTSPTPCSRTARGSTSTTRTPSTPHRSARTPSEAVLYDVAGEHVLRAAMGAALERGLGQGPIVVYKNNSDGKGNSYGCHENFLVDREVPFGDVVRAMVPHLVTRILYTGSGKVGAETGCDALEGDHFQLSQRAEFMEEVVGLETTLKRPIVEHPRRAARRPAPLPTPARHRGRREHVPGRDASSSSARPRCCSARSRTSASPPFPEPPADPVRTIHELSCDLDLHGQVRARTAAAAGARSRSRRQLFELARALRRRRRRASASAATTRRARSSTRWSARPHAAARRPRDARDHRRLDRQAPPGRGLPRRATASTADDPRSARARPAVPRPAPRALAGPARRARGARRRR